MGNCIECGQPAITRTSQGPICPDCWAEGYGEESAPMTDTQTPERITPNQTMIYVYRLPANLADGYAFGGGKPITFQNLDWFNGFDGMNRVQLEAEVKQKTYLENGRSYLVMSPENDLSFTFKHEAAQ